MHDNPPELEIQRNRRILWRSLAGFAVLIGIIGILAAFGWQFHA